MHQSRVIKIGPCGGNGGVAWDISDTPSRLESITIRYAGVIDGIEFSYVNQSGQKRTTGRWCGSGGMFTKTVSEKSIYVFTYGGFTVLFQAKVNHHSRPIRVPLLL